MKEERNWENKSVRVISADHLDVNTAQKPGMSRAAAVNFATASAQKFML
jgi:uncharacterized RmlC-like cupin family protein